MPSTKFLVLLLLGVLIYIAWLNYELGPPEINGISLHEYRLMNDEEQKLAILEARRTLFHKYLNINEVVRADCVARLFDTQTVQGRDQLEMIEMHLGTETNRDREHFLEELTINFITTKFCPQ